MIPLPALSAIPWKLVGWVALGVVVALAMLRVLHWRTDSIERLPAAQAALQREINCAEASQCAKRAAEVQKQIEQEVAKQAERDEIAIRSLNEAVATANSKPPRIVRVCNQPTGNKGDVRVPPGSAGNADHAGGGQVVSGGVGVDIGADVQRLVNRAEVVRLKCLAQQSRSDQMTQAATGNK